MDALQALADGLATGRAGGEVVQHFPQGGWVNAERKVTLVIERWKRQWRTLGSRT